MHLLTAFRVWTLPVAEVAGTPEARGKRGCKVGYN